jgi:hypothetical protein
MNTRQTTYRNRGATARPGAIRGLVVLVGLLLVAGVIMLAPLVKDSAQTIVNVPGQVLAAMLAGVQAAAQSAVHDAFRAVAENSEVNDRLGAPVLLPADDEIIWPPRPADAPTDELECQFVVQGPRGVAKVIATFKVKETTTIFELSRLLITPADGSNPIEVLAPQQRAEPY